MEPSKKIIMKNTGIFPFISFLFRALPLLLLFAACDKEIENPRLEALAPAGSDATGGDMETFPNTRCHGPQRTGTLRTGFRRLPG